VSINIIGGLAVLWLVGLGLALILGQRNGAVAYCRWWGHAIRWIFSRIWVALRWLWIHHREGTVCFLLGLLAGIIFFK